MHNVLDDLIAVHIESQRMHIDPQVHAVLVGVLHSDDKILNDLLLAHHDAEAAHVGLSVRVVLLVVYCAPQIVHAH